MRPIEAGCKAVIFGSSRGFNGIVVLVGDFVGGDYATPLIRHKDCWQITAESLSEYPSFNVISQQNLQRIDDDSEQLGSWSAIETLGWKRPVEETV